MSREPNKPGSSDDGAPLDDLDQTYESQAGQPAGPDQDPDATYDSIQQSSPEPENSQADADATYDSIQHHSSAPKTSSSDPADVDQTTDSVKPLMAGSTAQGRSGTEKVDPAPDETYDSQVPPSQNDLTAATHAPSQHGSITGKSRRTVEPVEATMASQPGQKQKDDEDFLILSQTKGREKLPEAIGRYKIKRLLGEGAFGKVYQATDTQLDRQVAVKVAKAISGDTQVQRFIREARAAAHLRHPNIIPVYEYGLVDGQNIIVYEFVEGETLKSFIKRKRKLKLDETVRIVREIAEGLNYAHEQGIIHRDMKPDNVLIDPSGHPHIADFGCARSIDDQTNLTIDGSILGTPMYMSPEQASGKSSVADGRTDIWSLGVMLYEMVSGKRPFQGQLTDLLFWICNNDPAALRKVSPETPIDIETLCDKCLTRDLDKRLPTAKTLADELGRFERGEPIESRRIGPLTRTWMWAKRNQAVASLLATVAVTLLIGTIVSSAFAVKAYSEQRRRAFAQMDAITTSEANALPGIFEALVPFRSTVLPQLKDRLAATESNSEDRHRLRMAVLELELDPIKREELADLMVEDLLIADPGDFFVCRECLKFRKSELTDVLWDAAGDISASGSPGRRFRAAAALALYDPESPQWESVAPDVAGYLTSVNQIEMSYWLPSLEPIREKLKPSLLTAFRTRNGDLDTTPQRAAAILSRMFTDQIPFLVSLVPDSTPPQLPHLTGALQISRTQAIQLLQSDLDKLDAQSEPSPKTGIFDPVVKKANVVAALIQLFDEFQWHQLAGGEDMSVASELIERLGPSSTPFELLAAQVNQWASIDSDVLAGVLLSLGQFKQNQILNGQRADLQPTLMSIFSEHADSRVHSSARWLLGKWGFQHDVARREKQLRRKTPDPNMNWHVDLAGNTFALYGPVNSFEMGLDKKLPKYTDFDPKEMLSEPRHRKRIPRRFGICMHEVTIGQFREFEIEIQQRMDQKLAELDNQIAELEASVEQATEAPDESASDADADDEKTEVQIQTEELKKLTRARKILATRIKEAQRVHNRHKDASENLPIGDVNFFTALAYCRWVSELQQTECGLPSIENLQRFVTAQRDFKLTQTHLDKLGYRLPTATEWEFACRGRSKSLFPFGQVPGTAQHYGWYATNSKTILHPVGQLKPGNTGLFDVLGNVGEWCLDWYREELPPVAEGAEPNSYVDFGPELEGHQSLDREYRGGSFADEIFDVRPTKRFSCRPNAGFPRLGFRLARTYEPSASFEVETTVVESK